MLCVGVSCRWTGQRWCAAVWTPPTPRFSLWTSILKRCSVSASSCTTSTATPTWRTPTSWAQWSARWDRWSHSIHSQIIVRHRTYILQLYIILTDSVYTLYLQIILTYYIYRLYYILSGPVLNIKYRLWQFFLHLSLAWLYMEVNSSHRGPMASEVFSFLVTGAGNRVGGV